MSPKRNALLPLTAFDPRYRELLIRGSKEQFSLTCSSKQEANGLRARIHTYRSQMKKQHGDAGRSEWEPLYLCIIYLESKTPDEGWSLRFAPRHGEFDSILSQMPSIQTPKLDTPETEGLLEKLEREQEAKG